MGVMGRAAAELHALRMQLTDGLLGEHALFNALLERIETIAQESDDRSEIQGAASLLAAAVMTHAQLEDELLFAALDAVDPRTGPVTVMRAEHAELDQLVEGIPLANTLEDAREGTLALIDLLRNHFRKEEHVLFPMSRALLGDAKLEELGQQWASRRKLSD